VIGEREGERFAYVLMAAAPAMFASNMLVARATAEFIPPVALAVGRWTLAALILLPFVGKALWSSRDAIRREFGDLLILGALGMGVCGAVLYLAAAATSATNMGLVASATPVVTVVVARLFYRETMTPAQIAGVGVSLSGVLVIIAKGSADLLLGLRFAAGDLYTLIAVVSWSVYSTMLQHRPTALGAASRFAATIVLGTLSLLPFLAIEAALGRQPSFDMSTLAVMLFLAVVPGLGAYQAYGLIQSRLGANRTSLILYLVPIYNAVLAWLLLGERLHAYHWVGAALALSGIYLTTRQAPPR
jgi:drug/metabolite transporter (DMT)-like permease